MSTPRTDPLVHLETTCRTLLAELQIIWDEIGETDADRDEMLLELERECMEVYRRKVDQANLSKAHIKKTIADYEAELAAICSAMGERPVHIRQSDLKVGSLKEELEKILPQVEEMKKMKIERINRFIDVLDQIQIIRNEISESRESISSETLIDETDLSLMKLEDLHRELHELQKEKSNRLKQVQDHLNMLNSLCSVMGMDFKLTVAEVHPSLGDSEESRSINNNTIEQLCVTINKLREVKIQRMDRLQDLATTMLELWNLMDTPIEEQQKFQDVTCNVAASEDEITEPNSLSEDFINHVEAEVSRLEELKSSKMKELVLKKRSELRKICRKTHLVPDTELEDVVEAIESGVVDAATILEQIELHIAKVKEDAFSRKEILEKIEKWLAACDEECWLEEYNRDENRYNLGKGTHLALKRAEKARALVNKLPAKEKTTAGLMAALSSMYEKPSALNKFHLMRRLFNLRMTEGASMAQHLNELNTITTQLSSVKIEFDDEVRALIILSSLPDSWNAIVTAVSSSSGNSKLKFEDVRDLVLSEEIRRRESGEASTSSALHTESRGRTSERNSNRGRSKSRTGKSRTRKKDFTCYNCDKKGCEWKITKGALVIARGKKTDTLYVTSNLENIIVAADADGKSNLWHQRLGHMSEKGMKTFLSKGKLPDLKNVDVGLCEDCIFGKQKKVSFAKIGKTPKTEKLELIHTDVWGPSPVPFLVGSLYYVTFIDDSTRKIPLLSMLEDYSALREEKEQERRRLRDQKRIQEQIIAEQEVLYGSKVCPPKQQTAKKYSKQSSIRRTASGGSMVRPDSVHTPRTPQIRSSKKTDLPFQNDRSNHQRDDAILASPAFRRGMDTADTPFRKHWSNAVHANEVESPLVRKPFSPIYPSSKVNMTIKLEDNGAHKTLQKTVPTDDLPDNLPRLRITSSVDEENRTPKATVWMQTDTKQAPTTQNTKPIEGSHEEIEESFEERRLARMRSDSQITSMIQV
ncbi:65-kDa microtubule-associated protein 3 [Hibiscus syriacus]|uniref:65-kDa microtubule-associated protein 3 n=1 Tax=Hibiscus syriacus TaxID=106335 RepID=A0A6A3C4B2_HIBSY|nr:65-kDa microtubule-associated protein 3 [Hibiscus syriacus]